MAESLKQKLRDDLNNARRRRDRSHTLLLTTTLSDLRNHEIEVGREASDSDVVEVVGRAIKRRREAAAQMRAGGREELAANEEREAELLSAYLPPPLGEAEVRALVREAVSAGAANLGAVMGRIMPQIKGRFDGREANRIAREELSGP